MVLFALPILHVLIAFTAAKWWMRPVLLGFDRRFDLPHCKESDFYFFCWLWTVVLILIGMYFIWHPLHGAYVSFSKKYRETYRNGLPR